METRIAVLSIIVEDVSAAAGLNTLLHEYEQYIIGRMGIPHRERNIRIISVVMEAPGDTINALTGALGRLGGVTAKATYSKL